MRMLRLNSWIMSSEQVIVITKKERLVELARDLRMETRVSIDKLVEGIRGCEKILVH